jgi:hypothetical protein
MYEGKTESRENDSGSSPETVELPREQHGRNADKNESFSRCEFHALKMRYGECLVECEEHMRKWKAHHAFPTSQNKQARILHQCGSSGRKLTS